MPNELAPWRQVELLQPIVGAEARRWKEADVTNIFDLVEGDDGAVVWCGVVWCVKCGVCPTA